MSVSWPILGNVLERWKHWIGAIIAEAGLWANLLAFSSAAGAIVQLCQRGVRVKKRRATRTITTRHEVLVVKRPRGGALFRCAECGGQMPMVTPDEAAAVAGVSGRTIYRWVEAGRVHFTEMPAGRLLVCLSSLPQENPQ